MKPFILPIAGHSYVWMCTLTAALALILLDFSP